MRHYSDGTEEYGSVTTILSETESWRSKNHIQQWNQVQRNRDYARAARNRGELIHKLISLHLQEKQYYVPPEYESIWEKVEEKLADFSNIIWSEGPLPDDWVFPRSPYLERQTITENSMTEIVEVPAIWSEKYKYAGCPDIIATKSGKIMLADVKTSDTHYQRRKPPFDRERGEEWRLKTNGYYKYQKTVLQLCAYAIAAEETLGIKPESMGIFVVKVGDPIDCCFYTLKEDEITAGTEEWLKRVEKYHKQNGRSKRKAKR